MSEINHFNFFILCKIMWHDILVIYQLLDDVDTLHVKRITLTDL
jgi:hypothetical protein